MTGRGEGYCAIEQPEPGRVARGYAGLQGTPLRRVPLASRPFRWLPALAWWPARWAGRAWAARRGRGRRW